ncbi:MAG: GLUG motif-containing protein, partial [Planctomycetota bacterium]
MADIDLGAFTGTSFNVIGEYVSWQDPANKPFTGVFDGNGHKISNFTYSLKGKNYIGLFRLVNGTNTVIKDLGLINPNVDAGTGGGVASLVSQIQDGTISNCYVKGGSITANRWVGGLVGLNLKGTITNCYAGISVSGTEVIGGLAAGNWEGLGTIYNSYSEGSVSGNVRVGGLLGHHSGTITNCYATANVAGTTDVGGLIGYDGAGSYIKSFWDNTINPGLPGIGNTTNPDVIGESTVNMQTESTFTSAGWDFVGETANGTEDIWKIREGQDYPRLSWEQYGGGGTGEPNDPYLIYTAEQMNAIGLNEDDWDKHFRLMADIDLGAFTGTAFNMIGYYVTYGHPDNKPFSGVFEGNGHTISNFTYSSTGIDFVGIFSFAWDAEIKNLGLIDPNVNGGTGSVIGSLAGLAIVTVSNCYARGGSVTGDDDVGGLQGVHFGHISESFTDVNVYGQNSVGGLIGTIGLAPAYTAIKVENCYALGNVDGNDDIGGLVGDVGDGVICNSYSAGHVSGRGDFVGGLVGKFEDPFEDPPVVISSYWDVNTSGQTESGGGTGKTTQEMMAEETFVGWGCNGAWTINEQNDYPRLTWENKPGELITNPSTFWQGNGTLADPYLVYTPQELNTIGLVSCARDKCFKLMADIDMSGIAPAQYNIIGMGFGFEFTGTFDGNNHLISNFSCGNTNERSIGIFGYVRHDANIMNLALTEPNVNGGDNSKVGALVGFLISGNIDNCSVVNGYVRGIRYVGGLVGEIDSFLEYATISNCYTTCSVEGTGNSIGGLVGYINNGTISRSFSTASVTGQERIGGLVGANYGTISNSYATGSVTATDRYGGGLAGCNYSARGEGYISNSYSTGRVTG